MKLVETKILFTCLSIHHKYFSATPNSRDGWPTDAAFCTRWNKEDSGSGEGRPHQGGVHVPSVPVTHAQRTAGPRGQMTGASSGSAGTQRNLDPGRERSKAPVWLAALLRGFKEAPRVQSWLIL